MATRTPNSKQRLPSAAPRRIGMHLNKRLLGVVAIVVIFAIAGIAYLANSSAATYTAQAEAEAGVLTGNSTKTSDTGASGSQAVKFGPAPSTGGGGTGTGVPARQIKIMPLGSSTVVGNAEGGFRPRLFQRLTQEDKLNADFVGSQSSGTAISDKNHEGHGGWLTGAEGQSLNGSVVGWLNTYKPDIVLYYAGTNDINGGASAATTLARMDSMANKIFTQSPNVKLIVGTLIQIRPLDGPKAAACRDYNSQLGGLAAKYRAQGRYMQVVDISGALGPADYPAGDNLHTNASGYAKIADLFYGGVRATYPTL